MQTPIPDIIYTVQDPKITNFSTFATNPPGPFTFSKYESGPNKGFYRREPELIRDGKPVPYTKAYFPKPIKDLYRNFLPKYKGFYYVPESTIPIRRMIFGLQNYDVPSSGNIEEFFKKFYSISVPKDFCPLIDPCNEDWCKKCDDLRVRQIRAMEKIIQSRRRTIKLDNLFYLFILIGIISAIVSGSTF
jgi:hypothetical protein